MARKFHLSICLNDIPDGFNRWSRESETNGKTYFQATIVERNEVGKYGETHFVKVSWKENDRWKDQIIGNIKPITYKKDTNEKPKENTKPKQNDLPF